VQTVFTILIADRNPRVRGFLQREMSQQGYRIRLAESARDLLQWPFEKDPIDLIILDPDLPDAVDPHLTSMLRERLPSVPVILHAHPSQGLLEPAAAKSFILVEKGGSSVECLKKLAEVILKSAESLTTATFNASSSGP
jgi:DNA-binding NtrC family response regulator